MMDERFVFITALILSGVLGLCIGSFLNVVIYRTPKKMSLAKPNSHCPNCGYELKWYDNVPVFSYLFLGGKCRSCKQKISPRYMIVEIVSAILYVLSVLIFWNQSIVYAVVCAVMTSILICVFFIDLEHMIILDRFQIIILALGIVALFFDGFTSEVDHVIGAFAGGGVFLLLYYGALWILGREGLGFGDVKLAFVTGLFLGWQKFLLAMLIASVVACIVLIPKKFSKNYNPEKEFPFAPFITLGVLVAMLCGAFIINWYVGILAV